MSETSLGHEHQTQNINPKETKVERLGNSTEILNRSKNPNRLVVGYRKIRDKFKRKDAENIESPEINEESTERIAEAITDELTENRTQIADAVQTARELNPAIPENANAVVSEIINSEEGKKNFLSRVKSYLKTSRGTKIAGLVAGTGASLSLRLGARAVLGPNFWVAILAGATAGGLVEGTKEFIKDRKRYDGDEIEARLEEAMLGFEVANKTSEDLSDPTKTVIIEPGNKLSMLERAGAIAKAEEIIRSGRVQSENLQRLIGLVENARFAVKMETQKPEFKSSDEAKNEKNKIAFLLKGRKETLDEKLEKSEKIEVKQLLSEIETKFGKIDVPWKDRMKKVAKAAGRGALVGAGTAAAASLFLDCLPESWTHALSEKAQHAVEYLYGHASPELTAQAKQILIDKGVAHAQEIQAQAFTKAKEFALSQTYQATVESGHGLTHAARDAVHDFYVNYEHLTNGLVGNIDQSHMAMIENVLAQAKVEELGSSIVQPGDVISFSGQDIINAINHAGTMTDAQVESMGEYLKGKLGEHAIDLMTNHDALVQSANDYYSVALEEAKKKYLQEGVVFGRQLIESELLKQAVEIEANEVGAKYLTAFAVSAGIGYGAGILTPDKRQRAETKTTSGGYSKVEVENLEPETAPTKDTPPEERKAEESPVPTKTKIPIAKDNGPKREIRESPGGVYSQKEKEELSAFAESLKNSFGYVGPKKGLRAEIGIDEIYFENMRHLYSAVKKLGLENLKGLNEVVLIKQEDFNDPEDQEKGYTVFNRGKSIAVSLNGREKMSLALKLAVEQAKIVREEEGQKRENGTPGTREQSEGSNGDSYKERKTALETKFGLRFGPSSDFQNLITEGSKRAKIMEVFMASLEDYPAEKLAGKNIGNIFVNPPESLMNPNLKGRSPIVKGREGKYALYVKSPSLESPTKEGFIQTLDSVVAELDSKASLAEAEARVAANQEKEEKTPEQNAKELKESLEKKYPSLEITGWENFSGSGKDFKSFDVATQGRIIAALEQSISTMLQSLGDEYIPGSSVYNESSKVKLDLTQKPLKIVKI